MSQRRGPARRYAKAKPKETMEKKIERIILSNVRGFLNMKPREKFLVVADFKTVLNNATLLIPYCFAYINFSNPLKANGGAATNVWQWSTLMGKKRKFLIEGAKATIDFEAQENFGQIPFQGPSNYQPPNTVAQAILTLCQPQTKTQMLGPVGSPNVKRLITYIDIAGYGGFNPRNSEDAHWGGLNPAADPSDNMYLHYGIDTNGLASVSGNIAHVRVVFYGVAAEFNDSL